MPAETNQTNNQAIEPIVKLLAFLLIFFTVALFAAEVWFKTDGQFFQVVSGMANGVMGALLGIITHNRLTQQKTPATDCDPKQDGNPKE